MEGLNVTKLEEGGGDAEYEEGEEVREDGSHRDHDHLRTVSVFHSVLLSLLNSHKIRKLQCSR